MAIKDTLLPLQIVANYNNKKGGVMLHTQLSNPICPLRQKIRDFYRIDEDQAVDHILPQAEVNMRARSRAWERARKMVLQIRREQERHGGVDALLNDRSSQSFTKTAEEAEYFNQLERQRRRLEQARVSNMTNNERNVAERYTQLNRRLK